ncbi:MAG: hypothetical protein VW876_13260 [Deltaproteobacteria bacterium]
MSISPEIRRLLSCRFFQGIHAIGIPIERWEPNLFRLEQCRPEICGMEQEKALVGYRFLPKI